MAIHFILIVGRNEKTTHYKNAVFESGHVPIVTDNLLLLEEYEKYKDTPTQSTLARVNLLLLPGGGDISPDLYNQPDRGSREIDRELDLIQFAYLTHFLDRNLPIIGICKGMQFINLHLGGSIIQDMPTESKNIHAYLQYKDNQHSCTYTPLDKLPLFVNKPILEKLYKLKQLPNIINSAHHQCIDCIAPKLIPFQYASDKVLEGYIHATRPILGFQWHPERLFYQDGSYLKLFLASLL